MELIAAVSHTAEISRSRRGFAPAHFTLKIDSFSQLSKMLQATKEEKFDSDIFETSGYKWKISLYPNGDRERNGEGHISLYLAIAETDALPSGWEVYASFKLFVLDQIQDEYVAMQDATGNARRFRGTKTQWGFAQFLSLDVFKNSSNGFLVRDKCVFGAEVFVLTNTGKGAQLSSLRTLKYEGAYTWKIEKFSSLGVRFLYSSVFTMGGINWKLLLYPKGLYSNKGKFLSLYIMMEDCKSAARVYVDYIFCIKDQRRGEHKEEESSSWLLWPNNKWCGFQEFLSLDEIRDDSKGFLVDDTLIVEAQITSIATTKNLS